MEIRQIEEELEDANRKIENVKVALESLNKWKNALENALKVLTIIREKTGTDHGKYYTPEATISAVYGIRNVLVPPREVRPAKGKAAEAGQALLKELRARDNYMKPMEVVRWLQETHGLIIGLGKVGRETSDLSAALGHGKVDGLAVSRAMGWGLVEWDNQPRPPAERSHAASTSLTVTENVSVESGVDEKNITAQESDAVER